MTHQHFVGDQLRQHEHKAATPRHHIDACNIGTRPAGWRWPDAQTAAIGGPPILVQIGDQRNDPIALALKAVEMTLVEAPGRGKRKLSFERA